MHIEETWETESIIAAINIWIKSDILHYNRRDCIKAPGASATEMCKSLEAPIASIPSRTTTHSFTLASVWQEGSFGAIKVPADPAEKGLGPSTPKQSPRSPVASPRRIATTASSAQRMGSPQPALPVVGYAQSSSKKHKRNFPKGWLEAPNMSQRRQ